MAICWLCAGSYSGIKPWKGSIVFVKNPQDVPWMRRIKFIKIVNHLLIVVFFSEMSLVVTGILKNKMKNTIKTRTQKIVEEPWNKILSAFSSWRVFSGYLVYLSWVWSGTQCEVYIFHSFIHLCARLVLQMNIFQGFLVISKSTARFPINNLVDWELRTALYKRLIKLH